MTGVGGDVVGYGGDSFASAPFIIMLEGDVVASLEML